VRRAPGQRRRLGELDARPRRTTAPRGVGAAPADHSAVTGDATPETWVTRSPDPIVRVQRTSTPAVSFVLVTYGTGTVVVEAISSLVESIAGTDLGIEVVVVDNEHAGRPHRTGNHLVLDTAGVRVVRPGRNLGFSGGCNEGARHAVGPTIALVNPDVEFAPGWIEPLLAALAGDAAIAAPVLRDPDGSVQSAGHRLFADGSTEPITEPPGPGGIGHPDYASAACWLLRQTLFDRLGGFDEMFFPAYYEDVDFALRAQPHGGTQVIGDSSIVHHRGASTASNVVPDTTPQRLHLLDNWPELASTQPAPET